MAFPRRRILRLLKAVTMFVLIATVLLICKYFIMKRGKGNPNSLEPRLVPVATKATSPVEEVGTLSKQIKTVSKPEKETSLESNRFSELFQTEIDLATNIDHNDGEVANPRIVPAGMSLERIHRLKYNLRGKPNVGKKIPNKVKGNPRNRDVAYLRRTPCTNVHVFYYTWYCNPKTDGQYCHWNHKTLPHWDKEIDKNFPKEIHKPPNDIASDFYPELGAYSSNDPEVIRAHFRQIANAGIGVVVVSYYPPGTADDNGKPWDNIYPLLLDKASEFEIKVAFHIEPYKKRNENTVRNDITYIVDTYGFHKGFYRYRINQYISVPMFYIYDSYLTKAEDWANVLKPDGHNTIRGTKYDSMVIGLLVDLQHSNYVSIGGFDGIYTYFAASGFTYGSNTKNWRDISERSVEMNFLYIPSIGPGYIDTNIRPWNEENKRDRSKGDYYKNSWTSALAVSPKIISITSFNEWHEGTQIENAVPKSTSRRVYLDYKPNQPNFYMKLTREFVDKFKSCN
ncbi:glycoprotein endo-alpha-1,2-mannosidase-like [Rhopilema esculentum]|uniref:glycoprotein endo-alpha-1,2-mannosidase-like n=1 Tax=Rhopilema esculentum TaxID=499914 RepID=UPI0031E1958F|eukprot:gene17561-9191_t